MARRAGRAGGSHRQAFGRRVRLHREAQGLSQEGLAELSGLHRNYVGSVERGERNIGLDNIHALAEALGITAADLFEEAATGRSQPPAS